MKCDVLDATLFFARPKGLEPPTFGTGIQRSIQLSYGRITAQCIRCTNSKYIIALANKQPTNDVFEVEQLSPIVNRSGFPAHCTPQLP